MTTEEENDKKNYLKLGEKLIHYYILSQKMNDINFKQQFTAEELEHWTTAALHLFNDLGTADDGETPLSPEEIVTNIEKATDFPMVPFEEDRLTPSSD